MSKPDRSPVMTSKPVDNRPKGWVTELAEELVRANADRGRTYDNSPDVQETISIIIDHFLARKTNNLL